MRRIPSGVAAFIAVLTAWGAGPECTAADHEAPQVAAEATALAVDEAGARSELFAQIAAQQEEIFSAKITYRWTLSSFVRPDNSPERVRALLADYDLLSIPDSLRELVLALDPEPRPPDPPWETRTFYMLGDKRRADTSQDVIQLVDGEHEMTYEGLNSQLRVEPRGKSDIHRTMIEDFRSYPPPGRDGLKAADFRIVQQDSEQIVLESVLPAGAPAGMIPSRCTFDRTTSVMTHYIEYDRGKVDREIWQRALTEYPGGIVMPALRIAPGYREGRLSSLRVFIIEEAEYNGPVPEERFVMPVAAGTVLVDNRFPEPRVRRTKDASDDVRSLLVPVSYPAAGIPSRSSSSWRMVLILNGIALIVLATVLWRKASHSSSPPPAGTGPSTSQSS
ncbi:MAG: hypothetical protein AB7I48_19090 [Planctomycetaceae bacterium]